MPNVRVERVTVADIISLRELVFRLPLKALCFDGDDSSRTWHFGAFLETSSRLFCCASFMFVPFEQRVGWQLRGMATRPGQQRWGIGAQLLKEAMRTIVAAEFVPLFWCNAQVPAIGFYEKQGWKIVSEEFDVPPAGPHRKMTKIWTAL